MNTELNTRVLTHEVPCIQTVAVVKRLGVMHT